jgi:quinol monooxygenase YgiN
MSDLHVIARARCQDGNEVAMEAALNTNAAAARVKQGCVSYLVVRGAEDRLLFMTIERWSSKADFETHMASASVQTLLQTIGPMLAGAPEIIPLTEV